MRCVTYSDVADVSFAAVSMSARSPENLDAEYIAWHSLDHLPEQYGIDAVRLGQRWVSTPACRAARASHHERFDAVDHIVQYLFSEPALDEWFALGAALREAGRMPLRLPPVELGGYELVDRCAAAHALVDPRVLPWRPARGAYYLVERGSDSTALRKLCAVEGVAGAWRYRGGSFDERLADTSDLTLTVCYLDGDVVATAGRIGATVAGRSPLLAAPFESIVPWEWDLRGPG